MTGPQISVTTEQLGDWQVLRVRGEIDADTAPTLRQACIDAVAAGHTSLIIDLSGVPFIDSAGLSVLITAQRVTATREGRLRVVTAVSSTLRLLRITGLDRAFDVHLDLASARDDRIERAP